LEYARNVSEYYLAAAEADLIPKWDFDAPDGQYRDTSAAAITASAFLELSTYLKVGRTFFTDQRTRRWSPGTWERLITEGDYSG
jgi:hypothetical protein